MIFTVWDIHGIPVAGFKKQIFWVGAIYIFQQRLNHDARIEFMELTGMVVTI